MEDKADMESDIGSRSGRMSVVEHLPSDTSGGISRPSASYSPLGAADSGYYTDSPQPSASSFEAAVRSTPAALSRYREATPPPGTFRPVSPQPLQLGRNNGGSGVRHVATQTLQPPHLQHLSQPLRPQPPPEFRSQLSTGFRPASAPLYELPDNGGGAEGAVGTGSNVGIGGLMSNDDAELDEDFDEEVYRSSAAIGGSGQPLPDLLQLRRHNEESADRHRSRSVPVTDESGRQERVALLLREIGDQYNQSRLSPATLFQAPWGIGGGRAGRDRRISLRLQDPATDEAGAGDWGGSIIGWMAKMARTLSGADIAREDENEEGRRQPDEEADRS